MSNDLRLEIEQLKTKNNQLQKVIDDLDINIYWKDLDGKMLGMNKKNLTSLGFDSIDDVLNKKDHEFNVWSKSSASLSLNDQQVIATGEAQSFEEIINDNNNNRILLSRKSPLRSIDNKVHGVIGVSMDITEYKELQNELKSRLKELEEKDERRFEAKKAVVEALLKI
jgi:PAS domain S-box-containing protein